MILLTHPTGNANVRQSLQALCDEGLLAEFWTCVAWDDKSPISRLLPPSIRQELERRSFNLPQLLEVHRLPFREVVRLLLTRINMGRRYTQHENAPFSIDSVYRTLDKRVAKRLDKVPQIKAAYTGEDGAYYTFRRAKELKLACVYDLPAVYWRARHQIYMEEREREPEWASSLSGLHDSPEKLERKDQELRMADLILVASSFTRSSLSVLPDGFKGQVHLVPYGSTSPISDSHLLDAVKSYNGGKRRLRVLFVGGLGQNKGLSYLLKAIKPIRQFVELTLIGRPVDPNIAPLAQALKEHRWLSSLPNHEVLQEMRRHDVLVLPSLNEGFGLVILEAMGQGTPVITTPNTGGPDVISDGEDGFIVPIRAEEAITERLTDLLSASPNYLKDLRFASLSKARLFTWAKYRKGVADALSDLIGSETSSG
jgi:glycosyltransferase involved in cell wall biosynthesis